MKSNEFDQLLSGLLGSKNGEQAPQEIGAPQKTSAASEESRRRVEEIMRNVERESDKRKSEEQSRSKAQPLPKREPVVVPPPISHFSDQPSQNPAVRMRDRLDETALPMIDSERKPTQIIPPKPKPEAEPKKKKKRTAPQVSTDIPAPPTPPKRNIPHIEVPDELPPDIPREVPVPSVDEERQKKLEAIRRAVREQRNAKLEAAVQTSEPPTETAEPTRIMRVSEEDTKLPVSEPEEVTENHVEAAVSESEEVTETHDEVVSESEETAESASNVRDQDLLNRAQIIRQQIRQAMDAIQSLPETEIAEEVVEETEHPEVSEEMEIVETSEEFETFAETDEIVPDEEEPQAAETSVSEAPSAPKLRHLSVPAEPEKKQGLFSRFRRNKQVEEQEPPVNTKETAEETAESFDEMPEEQETIIELESGETELYSEPEMLAEPEIPEPTETYPETEAPAEPEVSEEFEVYHEPEVPAESEISEEIESSFEELAEPEITETSEITEPAAEIKKEAEASIDVSLPDEAEKARKRSAFSAAIRAALDENAQELEDVKAEQLPADDEIDVAVGKSRKGKRGYFIAGFICTIFAVVGLVFCVMQGIRWIRNFADSSSLKTQLEDVVYPAVVMDLPEFEQAADAAPEMLMSAAVMDILMYGDLSQYTEVFDVISIPAQDVKKRADAMFGVTLPEEYMTLFAPGELFFYDESTGCYNVPSSPVIFSYAPEVQEIKRAEEVYTLTVVYRADTAQWQQRSENYNASGEKTMEITLNKSGDDYQIIRIKNVSKHSSGI